MNLHIESSNEKSVVRVKESRLIYPMLGEFAAKLSELIERGTRELVIDLSEVGYLDSASYGCLLDMNRMMSEQNGTIKLVGLQERVETMGRLVGLTRLMETADWGGVEVTGGATSVDGI
jgi:anti-sigma B factor antagonist